jgi:hypothetical protein
MEQTTIVTRILDLPCVFGHRRALLFTLAQHFVSDCGTIRDALHADCAWLGHLARST